MNEEFGTRHCGKVGEQYFKLRRSKFEIQKELNDEWRSIFNKENIHLKPVSSI